MSSASRSAPGLWAITCYFDPCGTRRRLANYRTFRQRLGVPLLAVELVHGDSSDLGEGDADILVQIRGGDILWQKERLLNIALRALPDSCSKVTWIDCDVIFGNERWAAEASALLESYALVQPYAAVHMLPAGWKGGEVATADAESMQLAIASVLASGIPPGVCLKPDPQRPGPRYAFGHAWAARRDLLDRFGFYDACIVGGADRATIGAAHGCFDVVMEMQHMTARQRQRYLAWAEPFSEAVQRSMTFAPGDLFHLWHGSFESRAYYDRHSVLSTFGFDPFEDIVLDANGLWRWNSAKPELRHYLREYFAARDGA